MGLPPSPFHHLFSSTTNVSLECSRFDHTYLKKFLISLNFCESVSRCKNQFISSVHSSHKVNFRVPWPEWPHPFMTMLSQKIFNHLLSGFFPACKKSVNFICSFLRLSQLYGPKTKLPKPNFCEFPSRYKKQGCFVNLLWRNECFKNPGIWLAKTILTCTSEKRFSPYIELVLKYRK